LEMGHPQVTAQGLIGTARALVADDKGLPAMDESTPTCNRRFARLGISQTEEARRAYRELIVTTPGLAERISGAILYDETIRQRKKDGTSFVRAITVAGIIPGIKVYIPARRTWREHPRGKKMPIRPRSGRSCVVRRRKSCSSSAALGCLKLKAWQPWGGGTPDITCPMAPSVPAVSIT
jgi:hypothetical protein